MSDRTAILGDSYDFPARPLYTLEFVESGTLTPLNLSGLTVLVGFIEEDEPEIGVIRASIRFDDDGEVLESDGLALAGSVSDGTLHHYLSASKTAALDEGLSLISGARTHRTTSEGTEYDITSFRLTGTLTTRYGIVNRLEAAS